MPESEGQQLKEYLKEKKMSAAQLGFELEMTPQGIYYQIKQDKIDNGFKKKLALAGRDVFQVGLKSLSSNDNNALSPNMEFFYKERIEDLKFTIHLLKEQIATDKELREIKSLLKEMNV